VTSLSAPAAGTVRLGLRENLGQFSLLVLINAFVGGMVGLERTVVPLVGTEEFRIGSEVVVFSFIIAFGLIKALLNLVSGLLADRFTRKMVLVAGWIVGLPVPFMLAWGPSWAWIVAANVLLGISQGLAWSMTVNMKIDLVGPARRGLAMGLNEAAGYVSSRLLTLQEPDERCNRCHRSIIRSRRFLCGPLQVGRKHTRSRSHP
jgi:MFS family permease